MVQVLRQWHWSKATALSGARLALAAAVVALTIAGAAVAESGIMLEMRDAPLREVITALMQQSGANLVIADSSMLDKKVTVSLRDKPLDKVLDYIVKYAGVSYKKMEDGTYIIGGVVGEEPAMPTTLAPMLPAIETAVEPAPKERPIVSIKLRHSKPSELLRLIGWDGVNPMPNCETLYPDRIGANVTPNPGGVYLNTRDGRIYDTGKGIHMENNQPTVPTIDPTSLNPGAGRTADQYTGAGQYGTPNIRPQGYIPANQPRTGTAPQPGAAGGTTSGNFLWPEGVDDARPFDLDNSIIVKGDEDGIERFKKVIRMLDVPPKQVQVKAEFIEVSTTDIRSFGIDWSLQRLNESFATAFGPTGNVVVGFATGNLTAQLKTQLSTSIGTVINAPIISTINNQNAYISITRTIPYWVSIATVVGADNIINQATPQFINIQTQLSIMPRVNGDGTITMILSPQVADTGAQVKGPDGTIIPEQRTQSIFTQRRVQNGETIVIGGFVRKGDTNQTDQVPVLGSLPIIGSLFRSVSKNYDDRELLIFVTPTIIPDVGAGTVGESVMP